MKRRIIIEIRDDSISEETAFAYVAKVMKKGKISNAHGIEHYCWATVWESGIIVAAREKSSKSSADSFVVYREAEIVDTPITRD